MSTSRDNSEDRLHDDTPEKRPGQSDTGPRGEDKIRNGSGTPGRKRTNWLRLNRVREPGEAPKRFSVWLGRLRRKKP